ncbi:universal stress protein [Ornithinimicrobium ciconiae]|uniref:Universal stress protein n=1 Tax=Ornithinimicrobium ciconiae TaxID=2594265 RepID=A0A516GBC7_9MICO|nr:universal stress protein [Ornithinimicrobium ciconiae]QDO88815.1 universal stress protein [Ornithinimicrobium ciconiae]
MPVAVAHHSTPAGQAAVRAALDWAAVHQTSVLVLHVEGTGSGDTRDTQANPAGVREAEQDLTEITQQLTGTVPDWTVVSTASGGDIASALLDLVVEHGADVLVIGSRRRSAVGKLMMGSTVQRVLLDSPVPVLVIKDS